jgi:hypothetical protein
VGSNPPDDEFLNFIIYCKARSESLSRIQACVAYAAQLRSSSDKGWAEDNYIPEFVTDLSPLLFAINLSLLTAPRRRKFSGLDLKV